MLAIMFIFLASSLFRSVLSSLGSTLSVSIPAINAKEISILHSKPAECSTLTWNCHPNKVEFVSQYLQCSFFLPVTRSVKVSARRTNTLRSTKFALFLPPPSHNQKWNLSIVKCPACNCHYVTLCASKITEGDQVSLTLTCVSSEADLVTGPCPATCYYSEYSCTLGSGASDSSNWFYVWTSLVLLDGPVRTSGPGQVCLSPGPALQH